MPTSSNLLPRGSEQIYDLVYIIDRSVEIGLSHASQLDHERRKWRDVIAVGSRHGCDIGGVSASCGCRVLDDYG
jgi:hypothetical protein